MLKFIKIIGIVFIVVSAIAIYKALNAPVKQTKDYAKMYVDAEDIVDATQMIYPPKKYSQLLQIDLKTRIRVAHYMEKNNLKLKSGWQEFVRINPTYRRLVHDDTDGFDFEKIS